MKSSYMKVFSFIIGLVLFYLVFFQLEDLSRAKLYAIYGVGGVFFASVVWLIYKEVVAGNTEKAAQIDTWHKLLKNSPDMAFELLTAYEGGKNKRFFDKNPKQAKKVFEGALHWLELVKTGQVDEVKKPELEDYYWLGLMYEEGFACRPDFAQAIAYYQKALSTSQCWDLDPKHYKQLCAEVEKRLAALQQK